MLRPLPMKKIRFSKHAAERLSIRGTNENEVTEAIKAGSREPAKNNRIICRLNFEFNSMWQGVKYSVKQVAPVIKEDDDQIIVITVYTYFF
jgi:hypothetical protein